jgi:hypothetical protein
MIIILTSNEQVTSHHLFQPLNTKLSLSYSTSPLSTQTFTPAKTWTSKPDHDPKLNSRTSIYKCSFYTQQHMFVSTPHPPPRQTCVCLFRYLLLTHTFCIYRYSLLCLHPCHFRFHLDENRIRSGGKLLTTATDVSTLQEAKASTP